MKDIEIKATEDEKVTEKSWSVILSLFLHLEILRGGFPSLCRQGLASVATVALNQSAGVFGDAAIAGMSVVARVTMFANSVLIGLCAGSITAQKNIAACRKRSGSASRRLL